MQIRTSIDPHSRVPTHTVTGALTVNQVRRAMTKLVEHPEYRRDCSSLWDLRQTEGLTGPEDVWPLVEMIRREEMPTGRGIIAFVLRSELFFAMGEPWERTWDTGRERVRLFGDFRQATEWLEDHEHCRDA